MSKFVLVWLAILIARQCSFLPSSDSGLSAKPWLWLMTGAGGAVEWSRECEIAVVEDGGPYSVCRAGGAQT